MNYFITASMDFEKKKHSTELATSKIIDRFIQDMDKYNTPINIYILTYLKLSTPLITTFCYIN